ncbi:hypothetical protein SODALDRAFT_74177 [Sodiomyces alkalinus F11]|uniref:Uncharacterized protein n=1 Tax=Sodiomyces alkalinus (strain CBS 110278 / VKM F-3762 / F11) TaxID=1314773 RepID=A0A3N2PK99_SODAK|nr:hypothetical protein SODALDRAFT_74177 [Sodiomyces alkalinus F11]ROT34935.1 hypothetical protein SODALDRAFT_74177 [Sodiomyces alkalinus F11]
MTCVTQILSWNTPNHLSSICLPICNQSSDPTWSQDPRFPRMTPSTLSPFSGYCHEADAPPHSVPRHQPCLNFLTSRGPRHCRTSDPHAEASHMVALFFFFFFFCRYTGLVEICFSFQ